MARGFEERLDIQMNLLAWHAANIMNVHLKKKVTPKKLLGREKKSMSPEDRAREWEKLQKLLGEDVVKNG